MDDERERGAETFPQKLKSNAGLLRRRGREAIAWHGNSLGQPLGHFGSLVSVPSMYSGVSATTNPRASNERLHPFQRFSPALFGARPAGQGSPFLCRFEPVRGGPLPWPGGRIPCRPRVMGSGLNDGLRAPPAFPGLFLDASLEVLERVGDRGASEAIPLSSPLG